MSKVITRFAPAPSSGMHIGNARTALINWLFAKKYQGDFLLRIDNTDPEKSHKKYETLIKEQLEWMSVKWKYSFEQINNLDLYNKAAKQLGDRLYECYETPEELEIKRKLLMAAGKPFIYDRAGLHLTSLQKEKYEAEGRKPHWRFKLDTKPVTWQDMIKGEMSYDLSNISDPILIRNNKTFTYMLCSATDDHNHNITHVIRGEDHIVNTAIQIQLLEALNYSIPKWGHLSLILDKTGKISKRKYEENKTTSYIVEIQDKIHPQTLVSFLTTIGRSKETTLFTNLDDLINDFDISSFSKAQAIYDFDQIIRMNSKMLQSLPAKEFDLDPGFWNLIKMNIDTLDQISEWKKTIIHWTNNASHKLPVEINVIIFAISRCPLYFNEESVAKWIQEIQNEHLEHRLTSIKKALRLILTNQERGPELYKILEFLGYDEVINRLKLYVSSN